MLRATIYPRPINKICKMDKIRCFNFHIGRQQFFPLSTDRSLIDAPQPPQLRSAADGLSVCTNSFSIFVCTRFVTFVVDLSHKTSLQPGPIESFRISVSNITCTSPQHRSCQFSNQRHARHSIWNSGMRRGEINEKTMIRYSVQDGVDEDDSE